MSDLQSTGRLSLRDEQKLVTRTRILQATVESIERSGYLRTTVDDIATAAGVTRATFYVYFDSKADVVRDLIRTFPRRAEIWESLGEIAEPTREAVRAWLDKVVALYDEERTYYLIVEEASTLEPDIATLHSRTALDVAKRVLWRSPRGAPPPADAEVRALLLWIQLNRFCFLWRVRGIEIDGNAALELLTDSWLDAMTP